MDDDAEVLAALVEAEDACIVHEWEPDVFGTYDLVPVGEYADLKDERDALRAMLIEVRAAYQGVGDLEGTGENMVGLIPKIDALLGPGWWDGRLVVGEC